MVEHAPGQAYLGLMMLLTFCNVDAAMFQALHLAVLQSIVIHAQSAWRLPPLPHVLRLRMQRPNYDAVQNTKIQDTETRAGNSRHKTERAGWGRIGSSCHGKFLRLRVIPLFRLQSSAPEHEHFVAPIEFNSLYAVASYVKISR